MVYMKRLKLSLLFNELLNNYIFIVLFLIINLLIYNGYYLLIIINIIYFGYIFLKNKILSICLIVVSMIVFLNLGLRNYITKNTYVESINDDLKVINIIKLDNSYKVYFKYKGVKILAYTDEELIVGATYHIKGNIKKGSTAHYKGGFDYHKYLNNNNIIGILDLDSYHYVMNGFSIYQLNYITRCYLENILNTKAKGMIKALTIGDKIDLDEELSSSISKIGISHLFVISGLHINLIALFFGYIFKKIKLKDNCSSIFIIIILSLYFIISGFLISVLRVILGYILKFIDNLYKYKLSNIDLMMINILVVMMYNPRLLFSYSFILSYTITTSLIICNKIINVTGKYKKIRSSIRVSILSILVTLPIITKINPTINLLSILYNIIYIPFISYIMLPLSFIVIFIPYIENLYYYIYLGFEFITNHLSNINILEITFPYINTIILITYYTLLYILLSKINNKEHIYKEIVIFIGCLFIWCNIGYFNINDEVYFIDLPKGEATLIRKKFNQCNILIDTGENGYDDILLFLKSINIKRLDFILISHSDSDHQGMLDEICEEFKVLNIMYNPYDTKTPLIANFYNIQHQPLYLNDYINIKDISLNIISPKKDYQNPNDNSMVIYATIFGINYLFTGDISMEVEESLDLYNKKIYILKLAHHGSNTSTSDIFLEKIGLNDRGICICMNGYKNTFSFPTSNTVDKIKVPLYITSDTKTICIRKNLFLKQNRIKLL